MYTNLHYTPLLYSKTGFTEVFIFAYFCSKTYIDRGYSLKCTHNLCFEQKKKKNITNFHQKIIIFTAVKYCSLLYNLKKRAIFIGLEPPRDQSIDCHIHWLARACRCILVTKLDSSVFHCGKDGIKDADK